VKKLFILLIFALAALMTAAIVLGIAAGRLNPPNPAKISTGAAPEGFVWIPGGTFIMGSHESEAKRENNERQHQVTLSGFYMGIYEVTQGEYEEIEGKINNAFLVDRGPHLPMIEVQWMSAVWYCNNRSRREGLKPAYRIDTNKRKVYWNRKANGYRLPTEAEWEYACRAGTTGPFHIGNIVSMDQVNYKPSVNDPYDADRGKFQREVELMEVGSFAPNAWGLYDMHGNVAEWCWDEWAEYPRGPQTDPAPSSRGNESDCVVRGGGYGDSAYMTRSAYREEAGALSSFYDRGFRLVRSGL
jgi:formylglycine-generating enzyme required for sulfatase activity